jgi:hypothetical protein
MRLLSQHKAGTLPTVPAGLMTPADAAAAAAAAAAMAVAAEVAAEATSSSGSPVAPAAFFSEFTHAGAAAAEQTVMALLHAGLENDDSGEDHEQGGGIEADEAQDLDSQVQTHYDGPVLRNNTCYLFAISLVLLACRSGLGFCAPDMVLCDKGEH